MKLRCAIRTLIIGGFLMEFVMCNFKAYEVVPFQEPAPTLKTDGSSL